MTFSELADRIRLPLGTTKTPGFRAAQLGAIHAVCSHFWDKTRAALVVMPTGSGKSAVMVATSVLLRPVRVLVVAPSRLLRGQLKEAFASLSDLLKTGAIDAEAPKLRTFEVTKKIGSKKAWHELRKYDVVIATPGTISPGVDGVFGPPTDLFDVLFFDEAHHVPARTHRNHTAEFWKLVERTLPESAERKAWLAERAGMLLGL